MKTFKRVIKYIIIGILILVLAISFYIFTSGPKLPDETDKIIDKVLSEPLPELIVGKTGFSNSNGVKIWYEDNSISQNPKGVVLLIMGISNDAMGWPAEFIRSFTEAGYRVIRYDHRGTGLSDWLEDSKDTYSLSDMALDVVSILDTLKIKEANLLGISMGGMIAQQVAINHPQRVTSLTSIMSSGNIFDEDLIPISSKVAYDLIKVALKYGIFNTETNMIKLHLASRIILRGDAAYDLNIKELSEQVLYNMRKRKGYNPNVSKQHQAAVFNSTSRHDDLKKLNMKTLIIHGKSDPFIPIEHGKKCVTLIPNADSLWIDNMGHDIPNEFIPIISKRIIANLMQQ